jgi:hypothetical protein
VRAGCIAPARYFNRRDVICKPSEAAFHTKETRLSFPVLLSDVTASGTRPRCVARIYHHDRHTRKDGFVCDVCPQLKERPTRERGTLSLSSRNPRANVRQVFQRDCSVRALGFLHDLFADVVIHPTGEPLLLASALLQEALGRLCTLALELCPHPAVPVANAVHGVTREHGPVAIDCDVLNSEINAERTIDGQELTVWNVARRKQIEHSVVQNKVRLAFLKLQECGLSFAANVAHRLTTIGGPQIDSVGANETQDSMIINDRCFHAEVVPTGLISPVGRSNNSKNSVHDGRSQLALLSGPAIEGLRDLEPAEYVFFENPASHIIASVVISAHRFAQGICLFGSRKQLHLRNEFQRQHFTETQIAWSECRKQEVGS